ncbi:MULTISPECIES: metallophosphoesterase [unclassified Pseudomonas]|uniref:metallophosphoesterase n=1 Tax=unclassified Pseudomonas TaxID=196821 RepID=UPI000A1DFCEA|nr:MULTISPECIES: metallophosphoesterase [unclassified Pseudomonas]
MPAVFVHVSDIHFGQEHDQTIHIHNDVKEQLIIDAAEVVAGLSSGVAQGIIVTGDIAQSGQWEQYIAAGAWLDTLAEEVGCPPHRVQMVPGNHDLDRSKLSVGGRQLLDYIRNGGDEEYEEVVGNAQDRATLLSRFEAYGRFCIGYNCGLHEEAKYAADLRIELAPNRAIRFVRMNSSLLCTGDERDDNPELMIGARQFTIPRRSGEENIVLVHHPLRWYKDAEEVSRYIKSRARVFISGHEHNPAVKVEEVETGCDLMTLAAGATVPFKSNETYTHTYNIIEFDWNPVQDALMVTIHPRAWNPKKTRFEPDEVRLGGRSPTYTLRSPNFRKLEQVSDGKGHRNAVTPSVEEPTSKEPIVELVGAEVVEGQVSPAPPSLPGYELTLLRFFRDLLENERLRVLLELDAIAADSDERMTQGVERKLFEWLARQGKLPQLMAKIDELIAERARGKF